jgi:outer membrane lipoprotein carrier protein
MATGFIKKIILILLVCTSILPVYSQSGSEALAKMLQKMGSLSSLRANININGTLTGVLSYKAPYQIHVKFSDGRVISANKNVVMVYSPASYIAGKQDLTGGTGGLSGLLSGYETVTQMGNTVKLQSRTKGYEEIIVGMTSDYYLKSLRMKPKGSSNYTDISISITGKDIGLPSSLFNYHPPGSTQVVENPLNQTE